MQEFEINVGKIEELQTIRDLDELDKIFAKAGRILNGGGTVLLFRKNSEGKQNVFDTLTTLDDLKAYRQNVFKYLY